MKIVFKRFKVKNLLLLLLLYSCSFKPENNAGNYSLSNRLDIMGCRIGIVACKIMNSEFLSVISEKEIEAHFTQNLINEIKSQLDVKIIDLRLFKVALNKDTSAVDIQRTDFLLKGIITGFSVNINEILGDEDMSENSYMFQAKVSYYLNLELFEPRTGDIQWTYSKKVVNADYQLTRKEIQLKELVLGSLSNHISIAVKSLFDSQDQK